MNEIVQSNNHNGQDQEVAETTQQVMTEDEWLVSWVKLQPGQPQVLGFSTDMTKLKMITKDFGKGPVQNFLKLFVFFPIQLYL